MVSLRAPALAAPSNPRAPSAGMPGAGGFATGHATSNSGSSKQIPAGIV